MHAAKPQHPARWCAPYAYKERQGLGCGGADKWTLEPAATAFPLTKWAAGSGSIFCDPGFFCPNTTAQASSFLAHPGRPSSRRKNASFCTMQRLADTRAAAVRSIDSLAESATLWA